MRIRHALVAAAVMAAPLPAAAASMVTATDPQSLVKAMQAAGYQANLTTDKQGDPKIDTGVSGTRFAIYFYGCKDNKNCRTVTFSTGYNLDNSATLEQINEWNQAQRFGRAYIDDEGDPILEMDLDLEDGGVTPALFIDNIEYWESALENFEKHIGY
jgi:hypothetical protein